MPPPPRPITNIQSPQPAQPRPAPQPGLPFQPSAARVLPQPSLFWCAPAPSPAKTHLNARRRLTPSAGKGLAAPPQPPQAGRPGASANGPGPALTARRPTTGRPPPRRGSPRKAARRTRPRRRGRARWKSAAPTSIAGLPAAPPAGGEGGLNPALKKNRHKKPRRD